MNNPSHILAILDFSCLQWLSYFFFLKPSHFPSPAWESHAPGQLYGQHETQILQSLDALLGVYAPPSVPVKILMDVKQVLFVGPIYISLSPKGFPSSNHCL